MGTLRAVVRCTRNFVRCERGATLVEYAILASLIAAVSVAIVVTIGQKTGAMYVPVSSQLP
jgi:Flp pilus assembly pilin Flp